ncbi:methyltransferase type 11 [Rhodococcus sp. NPDC127528]|uniref:methyltransferase type 11 n=1 Tax=unclassified Rhodococcus (in: high G+C Gram-positive bacteria) TaxID=192944 RepID=UPI003635DDD9
MFAEAFPTIEGLHVLDLGGTVEAWRRTPVRPQHVTVLNLFEPGDADVDWVTPLTGDACAATEALESAGVDPHFDLVFSNSLIEHVGGHARRVSLAREVRQLAPRHWVQTPYRYFPVEPHWLFPGMQFMPAVIRVAIARHWPLVHTKPESYDDAVESVLWTELVGATEMRNYFPTSTILRERVLGVPKSLIAVSVGG